MDIREITLEDAQDEYKVQIVITNDDGSETTIPKSVYDEQQKALKDAAN